MDIKDNLLLLHKNPVEFVNKAINIFKYWTNRICSECKAQIIDKNTKRFIQHNRKVWKGWTERNSSSLILFDYFTLAETEIARSYLLNILARKYKSAIASYSFKKTRKNKWRRIYQSFNVTKHIVVKLNEEQKKRSRAIFKEVMAGIKTKRGVFDLKIFGVWIGVDIYEEYLMRYTEPTIILDDPRFLEIIHEGIEALVFWKDFFDANDVKAIVSSHIGVRIGKNLPCKIAGQLFNIPFYSTHARSMTYYPEPHIYFKETANYYKNYHTIFKELPIDIQKQGVKWAKEQLKKRLSGEVGVDMSYSTKSAFVYDPKSKPVLQKGDKIKVVICPHEFYDSPNCYGGLLFMDFFEWLMFLGNISEKTDYDWYVKTHPDTLPKSGEIIEKIIVQYPRFKMVPCETSHQQLAEEGINFVLTCYGTVGHEYPFLGVQVINAGKNPHMGYDFSWQPETLEEYEWLLLNLGSLRKKINFDDIYEFYFMHHKMGIIEDWIFTSYSKMINDLTEQERFGPDIFSYFLKQLTPQRHQEIISRFTSYIDSGKIGGATTLDFNGKLTI